MWILVPARSGRMETAHRPAGRQLWPAQTESSKSEPGSGVHEKKHQLLTWSDLLLVKVDRAQTQEDKVSVWRLLPVVQAPFVAQLSFVKRRLQIVTVAVQSPDISTALDILSQKRIKAFNISLSLSQSSDGAKVGMCDNCRLTAIQIR